MTKDDLAFLQKLIRLLEQHAMNCDEPFGVEIDMPRRTISVNNQTWFFDEFMSLHWRDI